MTKLSFVGLGAMGLPMARRLAAVDGLVLTLFDTRAETMLPLADLGRCASSLEDAIDGADVVFSVVPADREALVVAAAVSSVARQGQIYVDFSTIAPDTMDGISSRLESIGVTAVSATCMKGVHAAEAGELSLFVGGPSATVQQLQPLLDRVAIEQRHVGSVGAAKTLKILNNLIISALDLMLCEALLIAVRLGSHPDRTVMELLRSGADSWGLRNHVVRHALTGDVGPGRFSIAYMAKDVGLAARVARDNGRAAFFAGVVLASYRGAVAHGHQDDYHPVVLQWLEQGAGSPSIASVTTTPRDDGGITALIRAVVALQSVITFEALYLGRSPSLSTAAAADHLLSGSAFNPSLHDFGTSGSDSTHATLDDLYQTLQRGCGLAHRANVPALTFEAGRNIVLAGIDRWGASASLADVLAVVGAEG